MLEGKKQAGVRETAETPRSPPRCRELRLHGRAGKPGALTAILMEMRVGWEEDGAGERRASGQGRSEEGWEAALAALNKLCCSEAPVGERGGGAGEKGASPV